MCCWGTQRRGRRPQRRISCDVCSWSPPLLQGLSLPRWRGVVSNAEFTSALWLYADAARCKNYRTRVRETFMGCAIRRLTIASFLLFAAAPAFAGSTYPLVGRGDRYIGEPFATRAPVIATHGMAAT